MQKYRIGIIGAHGTGKTTLLSELVKLYPLSGITGTTQNMWQGFGVENFEKLPKDIRGTFQKYTLINQIQKEQEIKNNYITDRTVIDNLAYTIYASQLQSIDLEIYQTLVELWLKNYTHLIYCPVEFPVEARKLRANINSREDMDKLYASLLETLVPTQYLTVRGSVETRIEMIQKYLNLE